jgi:hypothetical protein
MLKFNPLVAAVTTGLVIIGLSLVAPATADATTGPGPVMIGSSNVNATLAGPTKLAVVGGAGDSPQAYVQQVTCVGSLPTAFISFSAGTSQHTASVTVNNVVARSFTAKAGSYRTITIPLKAGVPSWVQPSFDGNPASSSWYGLAVCGGTTQLVTSVYGVTGGCQISSGFFTKAIRSDVVIKSNTTIIYADTLLTNDELWSYTNVAAAGPYRIYFSGVDSNLNAKKKVVKTAWSAVGPLYFGCGGSSS